MNVPKPSVSRATWVLVLQSFQRHWQVREMGWVALGLLSLVLIWDAAISHSAAGWGLENRRVRRTQITYRDYAEQLRPHGRYDALEAPEQAAKRTVNPLEHPAPLEPLRDSLTSLMLSIPQAVLLSEKFRGDWSFAHFVRSVMMGAYLSFVLPMFTLAYASGALGAERENRSLIWLMTRPMPRSLIYLAKFVGTLPWCLLFGFGGFAALCVAGGEPGRIAFRLFWPTALAGTIAFSALFHLIGSLFRRPIVVGLVYVFFFEFLVAILPGSMKLLSMTFYLRSLMYNAAVEAGYPGSLFEQSGPVSATAAWSVLASAAFGVTILGMILFSRSEYRDDV